MHRLASRLLVAVWGAVAVTAGAAEPIRVGAISSLTGLGASSDATRAAKAYFDAINASGGIRGRRIDYVVQDDRVQSPLAQQAAERLVADTSVVALAGGSSVLECAVNHQRYLQAGLVSLPGGGVDPLCFDSPAIAPVNAGPYVSTANALTFASQVLKRQRLCVVAPALPGMLEAFQAVVTRWAKWRGVDTPPLDTFRLGEPLNPVVQLVQQRGCDAVVYTGPEGPAIEWVRIARKAMPATDLVQLTSAYTTNVLLALGRDGEGIYVMAEFEPWSSSSLQIVDWRSLMVSNRITPSSLSQGGYLAAQMLVKVMRGIEGPVTRESVTRALREMQPVSNALAAEPYVVGPGNHHNPNRSALAMRMAGGRWRVAHPQWLGFPER